MFGSRDENPRYYCSSGNVRIVTFPDKQERLVEIRTGDTALWRYFNFTKPAASLELTVKSGAGRTATVFDGTGRELDAWRFRP